MKRFQRTPSTHYSFLEHTENDLPADFTHRSLDSQMVAARQTSSCRYTIPDMTPDGHRYRWTYPSATARNCSEDCCEHLSVIENASFLQDSSYFSAGNFRNKKVDSNIKWTPLSKSHCKEENISEQINSTYGPALSPKTVWMETESDNGEGYCKDIRTLRKRRVLKCLLRFFICCFPKASYSQESSYSDTDSIENEETNSDNMCTLTPLTRNYCEGEKIPEQINSAHVSLKTALMDIDNGLDMDDNKDIRRLRKNRGFRCLPQLFTCCIPKRC